MITLITRKNEADLVSKQKSDFLTLYCVTSNINLIQRQRMQNIFKLIFMLNQQHNLYSYDAGHFAGLEQSNPSSKLYCTIKFSVGLTAAYASVRDMSIILKNTVHKSHLQAICTLHSLTFRSSLDDMMTYILVTCQPISIKSEVDPPQNDNNI